MRISWKFTSFTGCKFFRVREGLKTNNQALPYREICHSAFRSRKFSEKEHLQYGKLFMYFFHVKFRKLVYITRRMHKYNSSISLPQRSFEFMQNASNMQISEWNLLANLRFAMFLSVIASAHWEIKKHSSPDNSNSSYAVLSVEIFDKAVGTAAKRLSFDIQFVSNWINGLAMILMDVGRDGLFLDGEWFSSTIRSE